MNTGIDPFIIISKIAVILPGAFSGQFRIFDLLDTLITDLCQPPFERLGLGRSDRLNDPENTFRVGAVHFLRPASSLNRKGMGNLPPPFGKFGIAPPHIPDVTLGVGAFGKHTHHVLDDEPPFLIVPDTADVLLFKNDDFILLFAHGVVSKTLLLFANPDAKRIYTKDVFMRIDLAALAATVSFGEIQPLLNTVG